ncbi:MAG: ATP synthase subunit I [Syntrophaceae bacterium]|nr:ATP synthase subunit I [Syntrophaceae bacterium]
MGNGLLAFLAGIALGALFFGGLWETVRRLPGAGNPLRRMTLSFLLRLTAALAAFAVMARGGWVTLAAAVAGFILAREILVRKLGHTSYGILGGTHGNRSH